MGIHKIDMDSGLGKKKESMLPCNNITEKLQILYRNEQMGSSCKIRDDGTCPTHNEVLLNITDVHAIYFTQGKTLFNDVSHGSPYPRNKHTHYLQALYLQQMYAQVTQIILPIYEYSSEFNTIKAVPTSTDNAIVEMWVNIISDLIKSKLKLGKKIPRSMEQLKIEAIDGYLLTKDDSNRLYIRKQLPVDSLYPEGLARQVAVALQAEKSKYVVEYVSKNISQKKLSDESTQKTPLSSTLFGKRKKCLPEQENTNKRQHVINY